MQDQSKSLSREVSKDDLTVSELFSSWSLSQHAMLKSEVDFICQEDAENARDLVIEEQADIARKLFEVPASDLASICKKLLVCRALQSSEYPEAPVSDCDLHLLLLTSVIEDLSNLISSDHQVEKLVCRDNFDASFV